MPAPADAAGFQAAASSRRPACAEEDVFYPSSDGRPMAENMWQGEAIIATAGDLKVARPDALVAAGHPGVPGAGQRPQEPGAGRAGGVGRGHAQAHELLRVAGGQAAGLGAGGGVAEHEGEGPGREAARLCGDGRAGVLAVSIRRAASFPPGMPRLQGLALVGGAYRPIPRRVERGMAVIHSDVLGLTVRREGELLRFRDPATGEDIRHQAESEDVAVREAVQRKAAQLRADREAARADREAARADQEAARVRGLEAALERARAGVRGEAL